MTEEALKKLYNGVVAAALEELEQAVSELLEQTVPETPLPVPKRYQVTRTISWPDDEQDYRRMTYDDNTAYASYPLGNPKWIIDKVLADCKGQPASVLRAVEAIEAATAWCRERRQGRLKAARNLLTMQKPALEELQRRVAEVE
jgi:hypothetical protein